jgi:fibronectin type 3 domain-containing protein
MYTMRTVQKLLKLVFFFVVLSLGIFISVIEPARAIALPATVFGASVDTTALGTLRQVRVDPVDGKVYVLGSSATTMAVLSADGNTATNVTFSATLLTSTFSDFVVAGGNVYILLSSGANGPAYKFAVAGSNATLVATHGIASGVGDLTFGNDGRLYFNKSTALVSYDTDLANRAPTTTLSVAASRIAMDGNGRLVYFATNRALRRFDLAATDVLLSSALTSYLNHKGLGVSTDSSAVYFADGTGGIMKVAVADGSLLWRRTTATALAGMDFNTSTGRITTVDTSGNITVYNPIAPPVSVSASPSGSSAVFNWTNDITDNDFGGVTIRRSTVGYPTSAADGSAVTSSVRTTTFSDTGLNDGTYYYTLFNKTMDGYYSAGVTSSVTIAVPPDAPTVEAAAVRPTSVSLVWSIPADTESFTLKRSRDGGPFTTVSTTMTATSYMDTGLIDGNYTYAVYAVDASGNISSPGRTTTVVIDTLSPSISAVSSAAYRTGAVISWITNEQASSQVVYSVDTSYASSTAVADTGGGQVVSHAVELNRLVPCTEYVYKTVSVDASDNTATSSAEIFTTTGCAGGAAVTSATSTRADTSLRTTMSLADGGNGIALSAPARFTPDHAEVTFQIKALPSTTVLASLGVPNARLASAGSRVFDLKALADSVTAVDSFALPVTITFQYAAADIEGIAESSLVVYHYHDDAWSALNGCVVDAVSKTITCTTTGFSTFGIFGVPLSPGVNYSSGSSSASVSLPQQLPMPSPVTYPTSSVPLVTITTTTLQAGFKNTGCSFTYPLKLGSVGGMVKKLQALLMMHGTTLYPEGLVTGYFGAATKRAVIRFQEKYAADILKPWGLARGTGIVAKTTAAKLCEM